MLRLDRPLRLLAAIVLSCLAASGARAEDAPAADEGPSVAELQAAANQIFASVDGLELDDVWPTADRLARLGSKVAPLMAARIEKSTQTAKLAIARALCLTGEPGLGGRTLLEAVRLGTTPELKIYAARAIGVTQELVGFEPVAEALAMILTIDREPSVQCAVCDAILKITTFPAGQAVAYPGADAEPVDPRAKAVKALEGFLAGADRSLAREAALVLGENGLAYRAREQLIAIATEPTPQGTRARLTLVTARPEWVDLFVEITDKIQSAYVDEARIDAQALISSAAKGMATSLDDFCDYLTAEDVEDMDAMLTGSYQGIGAWVGMRDAFFTIISPVYDGPAYRAGIQSQDRITEVDGQSTTDIGFEKTVKRLKGPKGTKVDVKVMRRGWSEAQVFTIVREEIHIRNSYTQMLPGHIGYVKLTRFGDKSGEEMRATVRQLVADGAKALVLDLRDNGGGLLSAAVEVSDAFLGAGKIVVYSQGRDGVSPVRRYHTTDDLACKLTDRPMAVLVNSGTASASEIVSGALQDWGRATIVGEKTFGKGSVQSLIPMRSTGWRTKLRLTIAKYYLPSGRCIDKLGIEPDVVQGDSQISGWESEQIAKLRLVGTIDELVGAQFSKDADALTAVAESDRGSIDSYLGLRELTRDLDARISHDPLRRIARAAARRRVADRRGVQFISDLQDDGVLRRGVYEVLTRGMDLTDLPAECRQILDEFNAAPAADDARAAAD